MSFRESDSFFAMTFTRAMRFGSFMISSAVWSVRISLRISKSAELSLFGRLTRAIVITMFPDDPSLHIEEGAFAFQSSGVCPTTYVLCKLYKNISKFETWEDPITCSYSHLQAY